MPAAQFQLLGKPTSLHPGSHQDGPLLAHWLLSEVMYKITVPLMCQGLTGVSTVSWKLLTMKHVLFNSAIHIKCSSPAVSQNFKPET
jgi:hypothetical protein